MGEFLFQFIIEFLLEVGSAAIFDVIFRSLGATMTPREERNPLLAGIGYALLGLIAGGGSLLIFPEAFARSETFHGISLVVAPVLAGFAMAGFGWLLERSGKQRLRLDSFAYGFIFAFPMAVVRFLYTS